MGHGVREDSHSDHRLGVGAPADNVDVVLLRFAHHGGRVSCGTVVLRQECQR